MTIVVLSIGVSASADEGPDLNVTAPPPDWHTRNSTVRVVGVTEPGINVSVRVHNGQDQLWNNSTSLPDGSFDVQVDLFPGRQNVTVQAEDAVGNTTNVTRRVVVDVTAPELRVRLEHLNGTWVPWSKELEGYAVRVKTVVVNGTYQDDFSSYYDVTLRISGVRRYIYIWPQIYERLDLYQGFNTIVVDVTDEAGNRAQEVFHVYCDSEPPPVHIHTPAHNTLTRNITMWITGETDPVTAILIELDPAQGSRTYTLMSGEDGLFEALVELFEGAQLVHVTAVDLVGNANTTLVNVVLDTTPPDFVINHPPGDRFVTNATEIEVIVTMRYDDDAVVFIDGRQVDNTGVVSSVVDLEEGDNPIEVWARDRAGNEVRRSVVVARDTIPPDLSVTWPVEDPHFTSNFNVSLEGTVSGGAMVTVVYTGTWHDVELVSGPSEVLMWRVILVLEAFDPEPVILVRATDTAGNEATATVNMVVDLVGPSLSLYTVPTVTNIPTLTVRGTTEEEVGAVTVNGAPSPVVDGAFNVTVDLTEGENTIMVAVQDRAGNEVYNTLTVILDTDPPEMELDYPGEARGDRFEIKGRTDPDVVRVWIDHEEFPVENGTFGVTVDIKGTGTNKYTVIVEDAAGNRASEMIKVEGGGIPGFGALTAVAVVAMAAAVARRRS